MLETEFEAKCIFKIRQTLMQIFHDRGYSVPQEDLDMTFEKFKQSFGSVPDSFSIRRGLTICIPSVDLKEGSIYIFFSHDPKIGSPALKSYAMSMQKDGVKKAIIVSKGNLTPSAKQLMNEIEGLEFEHFMEKELMFNITEHELVPVHIVLKEEEKKALLDRFRIKETQLPRILTTDPVARYYGMKRGQVVKIIRTSETAGRYVTYRWVV